MALCDYSDSAVAIEQDLLIEDVGAAVILALPEVVSEDCRAGGSRGGFDTWLLVENPGNNPASVRVSFMTETVTPATFLAPAITASACFCVCP